MAATILPDTDDETQPATLTETERRALARLLAILPLFPLQRPANGAADERAIVIAKALDLLREDTRFEG
jgi:hypothetical protein